MTSIIKFNLGNKEYQKHLKEQYNSYKNRQNKNIQTFDSTEIEKITNNMHIEIYMEYNQLKIDYIFLDIYMLLEL